jgi:hypothetical protein
MAQRERYAAHRRNHSRTNLRRSPDGVCFRRGAMAHHQKSRLRRTRSPGSFPDDLYDYLRPAPRRRGRPAKKKRSKWTVTDDWPPRSQSLRPRSRCSRLGSATCSTNCSQPATDPLGLEIAMTTPVRAALYLRVSTGRQTDNDLSIPDQRRQAKAYCASRCWEIVADYVEPGLSATDDRRPEFQGMIDAATTKPPAFNVILSTVLAASSATSSSSSSTSADSPRPVSGWSRSPRNSATIP